MSSRYGRRCPARRSLQATMLRAASQLAAPLHGLPELAAIWALMRGLFLLVVLCGMLATQWLVASQGKSMFVWCVCRCQ